MAERTTTTTTSSASTANRPPAITHVLETCLMVKDVAASTAFYQKVFSIDPFLNNPRMSGFALSNTTLLLFQLGATAEDGQMPDNRGTIPGHGPSPEILKLLLPSEQPLIGDKSAAACPDRMQLSGRLNQHFCFAVSKPEEVPAWQKWLEEKDVQILGKVDWPRGGKSVYFADPDGNVGEVGSRGIWEHY